jgi:hypothetical protein
MQADTPAAGAWARAPWGMAGLTRHSAVALLPAGAGAMILAAGWKNGLRRLALMCLFLFVVVAPWMIRNHRLTGRFFVTTHGAVELWFAFNDDTRRVIHDNRSVDRMRRGLEKRFPEIAAIRARNDLRPIDRELLEADVYRKQALTWIRRHPLDVLTMMPLKTRKLWTLFYNPVPTSPDPRQDFLRRFVHAVSYGLLLVFALAGIARGAATPLRRHALLLFYFAAYSLLHAIVYGFSRLRWPMDQFLILYAGFFCVDLYRKRKYV